VDSGEIPKGNKSGQESGQHLERIDEIGMERRYPGKGY
jgi:hypothetical protein